jgi:hypothetical protein
MPSKGKKKKEKEDKTPKKNVLINDDNILVGQTCYEFIFTFFFMRYRKK